MGIERNSIESSMFILSRFPPSDESEMEWNEDIEELGTWLPSLAPGRPGG